MAKEENIEQEIKEKIKEYEKQKTLERAEELIKQDKQLLETLSNQSTKLATQLSKLMDYVNELEKENETFRKYFEETKRQQYLNKLESHLKEIGIVKGD